MPDVFYILFSYLGGTLLVGLLFGWIWWGNRRAGDNDDDR